MKTDIFVKNSSHIASFSYNWDTEELVVEFVRGGKYLYTGVDNDTWRQLSNYGESAGKTFKSLIKGKFPYEKLS